MSNPMTDIFRPGQFRAESMEIVFTDLEADGYGMRNPAMQDGDWLRLSFDRRGGGTGLAYAGAVPLGRVAVNDFLFARRAVLWNLPYRGPADAGIVFVVDLPQDFAIFLPLLTRLHALSIPAHVIASRKFLSRPMAVQQMAIYQQMARRIDVVETGRDVRGVLQGNVRRVLCASESSVSGHRFCHVALEWLPAEVVKITFQHGFENVGLMHAPSHNDAYGADVTFHSDLIGVWGEPHAYPDVQLSQQPKLVSLGFIRSMCPGQPPLAMPSSGRRDRKRVMVAENLHSLRFDEERRDQFIAFVRALAIRFDVVIRPHPGGAYSVKNEVFPNFPTVDGPLSWASFRDIDFVVTPPSSIVFDAIIASLPVYIWSPSYRDSHNYAGLLFDSFAEFQDQIERDSHGRVMRQWRFFYDHIASVSGVENFFAKLF